MWWKCPRSLLVDGWGYLQRHFDTQVRENSSKVSIKESECIPILGDLALIYLSLHPPPSRGQIMGARCPVVLLIVGDAALCQSACYVWETLWLGHVRPCSICCQESGDQVCTTWRVLELGHSCASWVMSGVGSRPWIGPPQHDGLGLKLGHPGTVAPQLRTGARV